MSTLNQNFYCCCQQLKICEPQEQESLQLNTQRLKEFKSKMIFFPINAKKPRNGNATAEEMSKAGAGAEYAEPELFTVATLLGNSGNS